MTRGELLDSALHEFAAHGFEGASTRSIASRAGTHQPQINYHFESKEALWHAAVDHLFERLDSLMSENGSPRLGEIHDAADLGRVIRAFVRSAAQLPELNRIMVHEATADSERLSALVDRHTRVRFGWLTAAWERLRSQNLVADIEPVIFYYSLVGAASLASANAPEARLLGHDTLSEGFVERHAAAIAALFCGQESDSAGEPGRRR